MLNKKLFDYDCKVMTPYTDFQIVGTDYLIGF